MLACLRAGAPPGRLLLHGNAKSDEELTLAVRERIGWVIVDDAEELERLDGLARAAGIVQPILLRVIPEVSVDTHAAIATGQAASKFGTPLAEAPAVARRAAELGGLRLDGLQAHVGSQVLEVGSFVAAARALRDVAVQAGIEPAVWDIGGGFGVTYGAEASAGHRRGRHGGARRAGLERAPGRTRAGARREPGPDPVPGARAQAGGRSHAAGGGRRHVGQPASRALRRATRGPQRGARRAPRPRP